MKHDYTNKTVYIGIDVHKKTYSLVCICDGCIEKKWTTKSDPQRLPKQLKEYFGEATIKTVYEAGFAGFVLHRSLISSGIENIVVNPASIEISARDKVKTDKRDALKMAKQLSVGHLRSIYIPTEEQERARLLSRTRGSLVRQRTSLGQQIKSKLYQFGLITADQKRKMSLSWIKELKGKDLGNELNVTIGILGDLWIEISKKIKEMEKHLKKQAKEQELLETIYRSVPGIGEISSRTLSNELGDMCNFANEKSLFSYTGLTPQEYSSGEIRRLGHITRCGRGEIRKILIEASWIAIKRDTALEEIFKRIAFRSGVKRAIVAIARKLIGRIRACFQNGTLYEIGVIK